MIMNRVILHSDCNGFFASVACLHNPAIRDKPVVVGGDEEMRHGIVLAKNEIAKQYYVKTGEALWAVRQRCPDLVVVPPDHRLYLKFARMTREIYCEYTDQVEPFGIDESFLDVTGSAGLFGNGVKIANTIRDKIRRELGITVSIGVSYNKSFAKLGSDMKKPDATSVITQIDYKQKVWPLPADALMYCGPATAMKLKSMCIRTIGDLAATPAEVLKSWFGVCGSQLWERAHGLDMSRVAKFSDVMEDDDGMKSVGHSTTTPRDLVDRNDVYITVLLLSESIATRMRSYGRLGRTVKLWLRDNKMNSLERQIKAEYPTQLAYEIAESAMRLFDIWYGGLGLPGSARLPLRSVGVRVTDLLPETEHQQDSMFPHERKRHKLEAIERAMDHINARYGNKTIRRAALAMDNKLSKVVPQDDHIFTFPGGH
jgi:DNA polymerase-4